MHEIIHFFQLLTSDIPTLVRTVGLIGIFLIVFAESGLLMGFFLPGDSLLFTAGFLAVNNIGGLEIKALLIIVFIAAVLGDNTGYAFGKKLGPKIFIREKSLLFKREYITKAQDFYHKYGALTLVVARFTPIVRTLAPIMAGVAKMNYRVFFIYNVIGGALWSSSVLLAGYYLGKVIPNVDHYLLPIIGIIVLASIAAPLYHLIKSSRKNA